MPGEESKLLDKYSKLSTEELFGKWHDLTDFKKQQEIVDELAHAVGAFEDIENDYFLDKRGEHQRWSGKPKSKQFHKGQEREQAKELLNHIILESVKRDLGEKAAKQYEDDPDHLRMYLEGKMGPGGYNQAVEEMVSKGVKGENYGKVKQILAQNQIKDVRELQQIERELVENRDKHYSPAHEHFSEYTGHKLKKLVSIDQLLGSLKEYKKEGLNKFSDAYLHENYQMFKGLDKKYSEEPKKGKIIEMQKPEAA